MNKSVNNMINLDMVLKGQQVELVEPEDHLVAEDFIAVVQVVVDSLVDLIQMIFSVNSLVVDLEELVDLQVQEDLEVLLVQMEQIHSVP
jgi:hypothetical protein